MSDFIWMDKSRVGYNHSTNKYYFLGKVYDTMYDVLHERDFRERWQKGFKKFIHEYIENEIKKNVFIIAYIDQLELLYAERDRYFEYKLEKRECKITQLEYGFRTNYPLQHKLWKKQKEKENDTN